MRFVEIYAHIADIGNELSAVLLEISDHILRFDGLRAVTADDGQIFPFHDVFDALVKKLLI